jgi:hypothetical protein
MRKRKDMPKPPGGNWMLIVLAAALLAAMLWTWLGMERGTVRSRHGSYGQNRQAGEPRNTPRPYVGLSMS